MSHFDRKVTHLTALIYGLERRKKQTNKQQNTSPLGVKIFSQFYAGHFLGFWLPSIWNLLLWQEMSLSNESLWEGGGHLLLKKWKKTHQPPFRYLGYRLAQELSSTEWMHSPRLWIRSEKFKEAGTNRHTGGRADHSGSSASTVVLVVTSCQCQPQPHYPGV